MEMKHFNFGTFTTFSTTTSYGKDAYDYVSMNEPRNWNGKK